MVVRKKKGLRRSSRNKPINDSTFPRVLVLTFYFLVVFSVFLVSNSVRQSTSLSQGAAIIDNVHFLDGPSLRNAFWTTRVGGNSNGNSNSTGNERVLGSSPSIAVSHTTPETPAENESKTKSPSIAVSHTTPETPPENKSKTKSLVVSSASVATILSRNQDNKNNDNDNNNNKKNKNSQNVSLEYSWSFDQTRSSADKGRRIPSKQAMDHYNALRSTEAAKEPDGDNYIVYRACCGLGHRLLRNAAAVRYAREKKARFLWVEWTKKEHVMYPKTACGFERREVGYLDLSEYFFGPGPIVLLNETEDEAYENKYLPLPNTYDPKVLETRRFYDAWQKKHSRKKPDLCLNGASNYTARCFGRQNHRAAGKEDERYWRQIRSLYRFNHRARSFAEHNRFSERIVLGVHFRVGNNETGDFSQKGRGMAGVSLDSYIENLSRTLEQMAARIREAQKQSGAHESGGNDLHKLPPLVFVATDDVSVLPLLEEAVKPHGMVAVSLPQIRLPKGTGVSYGASWDTIEECREGWNAQILDMVLVGAADAVIATRYSSFTMAIPLMAVFSDSLRGRVPEGSTPEIEARKIEERDLLGSVSRDEPGKVRNASVRFAHRLFCETSKKGDAVRCYDDYQDWAKHENGLFVPSQEVFHAADNMIVFRKTVMGRCP